MERFFTNVLISILFLALITCIGATVYMISVNLGVNKPAVITVALFVLLLTNEYRNRMDKKLFK
jgi:hypothetical protein